LLQVAGCNGPMHTPLCISVICDVLLLAIQGWQTQFQQL